MKWLKCYAYQEMAEIQGLFLRNLPKVNFNKTVYITNMECVS